MKQFPGLVSIKLYFYGYSKRMREPLIFITNMDNSSYAFEFVKGATIPMILGNAVAVGGAIIIVSLLSHERISRNKGGERIANTFQRWLLLCIVIAYLVTSAFTYILQNGIVKIETQEVFTSAINDVEAAVKGKSDAALLQIAQDVKAEYEGNPAVTLKELKEKYNVVEINVIDCDDKVEKSTDDGNVGYDMNLSEQSKEFVDILKAQDYFVQKYSPRGIDGTVWRKYAAIKLTGGGFIQVGYDAEQFHKMLDAFVIDVTKNRHVGTSGFVAVCDEKLNMVIDNDYADLHISAIGINPPLEMQEGKTATALYYADIVDGKTDESLRHMLVYREASRINIASSSGIAAIMQ